MDKHICPFGIKAKWLLQREGFVVDDHHLRSRAETDSFKREHGVDTTPQIFINGQRIGGYEELREHLGKSTTADDDTSYQPVAAVFFVAVAVAFAFHWAAASELVLWRVAESFVALSMALLAMLKLQDVRAFSTTFLNYDLLARRWVPYSFIYPFAEAMVAILMLGGILTIVAAPVAIVVGGIGTFSVVKAVWIDHREIKCACVGGNSKVPLGFVSLSENVAMVSMGGWMLVKALGLT